MLNTVESHQEEVRIPSIMKSEESTKLGMGNIPEGIRGIGAKPNLYCDAIELVCGGSTKVCVLVERKALDRVKSEL